jgi:uncharacterized repeat protein (TIGR02543 family)
LVVLPLQAKWEEGKMKKTFGKRLAAVLATALAVMLLTPQLALAETFVEATPKPLPAEEAGGALPAAPLAGLLNGQAAGGVSAASVPTLSVADPASIQTGDVVKFGSYPQSSNGAGGYNTEAIEWYVLENEGDKLFLLSKKVLDTPMRWGPYGSTGGDNARWDKSDIKTFLNGEFLSAAFTSGEVGAISTTAVENKGNPAYPNINAGANPTPDKVFLPSYWDMTNSSYGFPTHIDSNITIERAALERAALATDYAASKQLDQPYYAAEGDRGAAYWLRTPGGNTHAVLYITAWGSFYQQPTAKLTGQVVNQPWMYAGDPNKYYLGIRPALKLDISQLIFTSEDDPSDSPYTAIPKGSLAPTTITTAVLPDSAVGQSYSQSVEATYEDGFGVTYSLVEGTLPAGLSLDPATGIVSGVPTVADTYIFKVRAENAIGFDEKEYTITIDRTMLTVSFLNYDNSPISVQNIDWGGNATTPPNPSRDGYTFTGWSLPSSAWSNVTSSVTITATYQIIPVIPPATNPITDGGVTIQNVVTTPFVPFITPDIGDANVPDEVLNPTPVTPTPPASTTPAVIPDSETPLAGSTSSSTTSGSMWALLDLICAIVAVLALLVCVIVLATGRERYTARKAFLAICAVAAVANVVLFLITQDLSQPMGFVDFWSIPFAVIAVLAIITAWLTFAKNAESAKTGGFSA